ncbi:hypothetical protein Tco_1567299 [Tanacetum coccineum]
MLGFSCLDGKDPVRRIIFYSRGNTSIGKISFSFVSDERMMRRIYNDEGRPRIIKADGRRTSVAWPMEDVLSWPGNANMAFDLRPTEDVLPWPGNANMAFDLVPDLQCLLCTFYIQRYLRDMHEDNYNGIVISL